MEAHTPETWELIISKLPAPIGDTVETHVARRIIGDLVGMTYAHAKKYRARDTAELANALTAYGNILLRAYGVNDTPRKG